MSTRHRYLLATFIAGMFLLLPSIGCKSKLTGNEGNLTFSYFADDRIRDFNKPIAVGAKLDLEVETSGTPAQPAQVESASSDDTNVLDVVTTSGNTITVEGKGDGNVLLSVSADAGGAKGVLTDSVNLNVRVPEVQKLNHTCTDQGASPGTYIVGQEIWVPYELEMSNGQPVIGYGYYPATPVPAEGLALTNSGKEQQYMKFMTGSAAGAVTLESDIDDTVWSADLIEESAIDGAELVTEYSAFVDVRTLYYVLPTTGGKRVCQARTDYSVVSDTPEICTVESLNPTANETSLSSAVNEFGWLAITGSQVGVCQFSITYSAGMAGAGVTTQLSADIIMVETPLP